MPGNPLQDAASASGCAYTASNQMKLIKNFGVTGELSGAGGICYGLSVCWLERQAHGGSGSFFSDLAEVNQPAAFRRAQLIFQKQNERMRWQDQTGLTPATREDQYGNIKAKRRSFSAADIGSMKQLAAWLCAANGRRYFLLHVPGHCMAATGSRMGSGKFYDPNFGVVSSFFGGRVADCMHRFLSDERTVKHYWKKNGDGPLPVEAQKFKLTGAQHLTPTGTTLKQADGPDLDILDF